MRFFNKRDLWTSEKRRGRAKNAKDTAANIQNACEVRRARFDEEREKDQDLSINAEKHKEISVVLERDTVTGSVPAIVVCQLGSNKLERQVCCGARRRDRCV